MENVTPPPAVSASTTNTWNFLCHLSALLGYIIPVVGSVLGPFIVWQVKKNEIPSVDIHGKEAVNFQLSIFLYYLIAGLLIFVAVGIPLIWALALFNLVMIVIATIKSANGEVYRYPLCIRFLK